MSQTIVDLNQPIGLPGQKANIVPDSVRSYIAEADLGFGLLVVAGTDPDRQVKPPALSTDITVFNTVRGVTLRDVARENGAIDIEDESAASVLEFGDVFVTVETAVTPASSVFVRFGGVGTPGAFRNDADGSNAAALANARFITSAGIGEIAILRITR